MNYYDRLVIKILRRIPPSIRGKRRISRFLLSNIFPNKDILIEDSFGFSYKVPSITETVAFSLLVDGIYEPISLNLIKNYLVPGDVFVDIGANIGAFTFPCASRVGLSGKVIAIEASPTVLDYLKKNITLNKLNNIKLEECAVAENDFEEKFFYEAPSDHFGMGSFGPQFQNTPITLKCRTLDSILKDNLIHKVKAIKIDVEGYEAMVFKGARQLLTSADAPLILFEFIDWAEKRLNLKPGDSQRQLLNFGYDIWLEDDFIHKKPPLDQPLTIGGYNLVAVKSKMLNKTRLP